MIVRSQKYWLDHLIPLETLLLKFKIWIYFSMELKGDFCRMSMIELSGEKREGLN